MLVVKRTSLLTVVANTKFRNRPISGAPRLFSFGNMARHDIDRLFLRRRVQCPRSFPPRCWRDARDWRCGQQRAPQDPKQSHTIACLITADASTRSQGQRERTRALVCQFVCQTADQPSELDQEFRKSKENLVSREGIEPSTRRLRVCCSAN